MEMCVRKEKTLQKQRGEGKVWLFPEETRRVSSSHVASVLEEVLLTGFVHHGVPVLEQVFTLKDLLPGQRTRAGAALS